MKSRITLLGSTGSIGKSTLSVIRALRDRLEITALAANSNVELLAEQAIEFNAKYAAISDENKYGELKRLLPSSCTALAGKEALCTISSLDETDTVLCAIVGTGGLAPSLAALESKKRLALASKEVMVMAGRLATETAKRSGAEIIPVDSEHNALFQCLNGRDSSFVRRLILTASGGPFRNFTLEELEKVTLCEALKHPVWSMGVKVTLDSATLMNKALEMVEARWLFDIGQSGIDVLVHPQSAVHSLVEFNDGTMLAELSRPDMRFPIQYALTYPERLSGGLERLDLAKLAVLSFSEVDNSRFPSITIARNVLDEGGTMPCAMNAANEVAVERFIKGEIAFTDIWRIIENTLAAHKNMPDTSLEAIKEADTLARECARNTFAK